MTEQLQVIKIEDVPALVQKNLPQMIKSHQMAVAAMEKVSEVNDDNSYEQLNNLLVRVKKTHDIVYGWRTEITSQLDEFKKQLMAYEKPLSDGKDSLYSQKRQLLTDFKQKQLEEIKRVQAEADAKKERENKLAELKGKILQNLNDLSASKIKQSDSGSSEYFRATTLETFDKRAEAFMKMKPKLKQEDWTACFSVDFNGLFGSDQDRINWLQLIMDVESYEKYNQLVIDGALPILNEWRAKIPQLKQQLIDLKNAGDEDARKKLLEEQNKQAEEELKIRQQQIDSSAHQKANEIQHKTDMDKINNEFVSQVTIQELGDAGPAKKIIKFTDKKLVANALSKMIYHTMINPKFKGIEKRDKSGAIVKDETGEPEYIDAVDWWLKFFIANCDADIDGTKIFDVAKIQVRKK